MTHDDRAHAAEHAGSAHPPAEEDRIQSRTIVLVGVGALIVFFVASLAAIAAMRRLQSEIVPDGPAPLPKELGSAKIGMLEQRLFESSNQVQVMNAVQRRKLETWGWIDRERGVARMPIDRAMDLVVKGERPPPSPGLEGPRGGRPDVGTGGTQSGGAAPPKPQPSQRSPVGGLRR